ncbi:MAG TPA: PLP-dependent aminotransferase family protein [Nocardioides sp.]|nr:PLP-dependent aminotransferase family protein [Nocardioides sp.]
MVDRLGALEDLVDRSPRGIAGAVSRAIRAGELAPGDRLPTVRSVADSLGVSPGTVSAAWQALRRKGLIVARGRSGSFVQDAPTAWLSPRHRDLVGAGLDGARLDLSRGIADPSLLPSLGPALRRVSERAEAFAYQAEPVLPGLRAVLVDAWPARVETLTVVDGATDGIARVLEEVAGYGDRVVLESPGYPPLFDLVESLGAEVVPVRHDAEGILPRSLEAAMSARPTAVVLQPRAQNPTGRVMSEERAERLVRVMTRRGVATPWIVEDDHSHGISTATPVSLARWLPERVVHVRSFSKSHGPDLRIAAMGGPGALLDRVVARRMLGPAWTSRMVQTILLELLTAPSSVAQVEHARSTYAARQGALVAALGAHGVSLEVPDGINLWLPVRDERAALLELDAAGIRVAGGTTFLATPGTDHPAVRVTSGLVAVEDADEVAAALAAASRG